MHRKKRPARSTTTARPLRGVVNTRTARPLRGVVNIRMRATAATAVFVLCSLTATSGRAADHGEPKLHRFWVGLTFGLTTVWHPSGSDVCGQPSSGWTCAQSGGGLYPPRYSLPGFSPSRAEVSAGFGGLAGSYGVSAIDFALTDGFLLGLRFGTYFHPGNVNVVNSGAYPFIYEARATWVLGPHPLTRSGIRVYTLLGVGMGDFSAPAETGITAAVDAGDARPIQAWRVAGPGFATTGVGIRIGTPRFALMIAPFKITLPVGSGSTFAFMPELAIMSAPF